MATACIRKSAPRIKNNDLTHPLSQIPGYATGPILDAQERPQTSQGKLACSSMSVLFPLGFQCPDTTCFKLLY